MAQVSVRINGRSYDVACDDGQEERLINLAQYVDERVREIAGAVGQIGEQRLLVMTSLLIADELGDVHEKLRSRQTTAAPEPGSVSAAEGDAIAENMESMAVRIEAIAQKLSQD
ncbi:cell division protein ZapA [Thalassospira sp. A3_1]|uniref:cell division protein ZapA n=1 Tax=Thalassospira sp. A3_1 TaxID=2821088 RepID=UPI001ADCAF90|nr:cell division protein ZapA [Thalassospira sp. A3_1]MBO9508431.1 cell division protein ZapA [Thalassospira sp. A3_1]